jgi:hypothetical protein
MNAALTADNGSGSVCCSDFATRAPPRHRLPCDCAPPKTRVRRASGGSSVIRGWQRAEFTLPCRVTARIREFGARGRAVRSSQGRDERAPGGCEGAECSTTARAGGALCWSRPALSRRFSCEEEACALRVTSRPTESHKDAERCGYGRPNLYIDSASIVRFAAYRGGSCGARGGIFIMPGPVGYGLRVLRGGGRGCRSWSSIRPGGRGAPGRCGCRDRAPEGGWRRNGGRCGNWHAGRCRPSGRRGSRRAARLSCCHPELGNGVNASIG